MVSEIEAFDCIVVWLGRPVLVSQEERSKFWEVIVSVILSKNIYTNMCPILNGVYGCTIRVLWNNQVGMVVLSGKLELWWTVALVGILFWGENWIHVDQVRASWCVTGTWSYRFGFLERLGNCLTSGENVSLSYFRLVLNDADDVTHVSDFHWSPTTTGSLSSHVSLRLYSSFVCFFFLARQPPVGQGLFIHEVSRPHTTTHHSR
jgi:hypothetical protein